jgi:hypothetical protein
MAHVSLTICSSLPLEYEYISFDLTTVYSSIAIFLGVQGPDGGQSAQINAKS